MKWKTVLFALILCFFISGCGHDILLSTLRQSQWYQKQLEIVNEPRRTIFEQERFLWYGKVVAVQDGIVTLKPYRKLSGFFNVKEDSLVLWFPGKKSAELSIGTWIAARTERSLKDQYVVQDYRVLTQVNAVPDKFTAIYEKILLLAIQDNWHLKVKVLDNGRTLKISNGTPRKTKFYGTKLKNGYTSTRTEDGVFFSGDVFEYIVSDTEEMISDPIRVQNTPGGLVWGKCENNFCHVFRCGYNFDSFAFQEITGEYPDVRISQMIRFPIFLESSGAIAMNPSTKARREELQKAFDKAGIPGEWKIGDMGSMIFYSDCRDFELDVPLFFNDNPITVQGPNPKGFIFSLSTPRTGAIAYPVYLHPRICNCPWFYYWKTVRDLGYIAWGNAENMVSNTWNFEFGDQVSAHTELLGKILETIRALPPWTLPKSEK